MKISCIDKVINEEVLNKIGDYFKIEVMKRGLQSILRKRGNRTIGYILRHGGLVHLIVKKQLIEKRHIFKKNILKK